MLLNINEVARDYLRVSRSTVYRLIEQGEIRSVKVRGCTRVSEKEINLFIESNGTSR
jgi:excisionase family DNA binding protein